MAVIINQIFTFGIEHRLIGGMDRSPAWGISLGRDEEKKPEILTLTEIRKLLQEARRMNHEWFPIWSAALLTGMRSGELYALAWDDVDFENKTLNVNKSYSARIRAVKSTKAGYWRHVPMSDELSALLTELRASAGERREVLPRSPSGHCSPRRPPVKPPVTGDWPVNFYIRLAGIETQGATNALRVLPAADVAAQVVNLFTKERIK